MSSKFTIFGDRFGGGGGKCFYHPSFFGRSICTPHFELFIFSKLKGAFKFEFLTGCRGKSCGDDVIVELALVSVIPTTSHATKLCRRIVIQFQN